MASCSNGYHNRSYIISQSPIQEPVEEHLESDGERCWQAVLDAPEEDLILEDS